MKVLKDFSRESLEESKRHIYFMRMALSLAARGGVSVSPNPKVGCVLVREGKVVGFGYHRRYGGPHAEAEALAMAGDEAAGSTAYVTLEPCSHHGKTPPCAPRLVNAGVARVVYGLKDPNPKVNGEGLRILESGGVEVVGPVLEDDCKWINRGFLRRVTMGRPWVTLKGALSVDGTACLESGESKWITGPMARQKAHLLRAENDAVLVGINTVINDDPELTVRALDGENPKKVILDGDLRIPMEAKVLKGGERIIFTSQDAPADKLACLSNMGVTVIQVPRVDGRLDLNRVLAELGRLGVNNLLVEGGARVLGAFVESGLGDMVSLFIAPSILGRGLHIFESFVLQGLGDRVEITNHVVRQSGRDLWLEGVLRCSPAL
ncbi:MAG: bifunctional diaminohydroxyphosphoribosylaminopyrimidine deaminase/5-amino-6-(5-phosphoribosylamino)uracil reductase RibD [Thermanaerothrix sp.]|nr:bifunctional diaminohydroxyphosphoribosylaminopyrimidine deaminase/5-amino-6-(5-phosphoribosylamino)uracil reductase RibD [Thermanaerothrix sp.]